MATETVQHLIHDELQDSCASQEKASIDLGDIGEKERQILPSVRPGNPFLITDHPEEKQQLGISSRGYQVDDFELVKTLGTGKSVLIYGFVKEFRA